MVMYILKHDRLGWRRIPQHRRILRYNDNCQQIFGNEPKAKV
jgi:hypothetical protein